MAHSVALALARLLLRLTPGEFRDQFGAEIEADFAARWADARGVRRRAGLLLDLAAMIPREWRDELAQSPNHPEPQRRVRMSGIDLKHLIRWLARSPAFAISALGTLAVGIGVTTAIFAVYFGVLLRPLPFPEPDRLMHVTRGGDVSLPDGVDWRARSRSFVAIGLYARNWSLDLTGLGDPEPVFITAAEKEFLDVLGIKPIAGRLFTAEENQPGQGHVIVLAEDFWRTRFGGSPAAIGSQLTLAGNSATIIGVVPRSADFLDDGVIGIMPIAAELPWAVSQRGTNNLDAVARVRPGVALADAARELHDISASLAEEYPRTNRGKIVEPIALTEFLVGTARPTLRVVLGAVVVLLLIASVNLAGLLVARVSSRRREFSVRMALGAGARRITGQLVFEGLALSLAGGVLGLGVAAAALRLLRANLPASVPRAGTLELDGPVLAFGLAATVVAGILCGVLPAFRNRRPATEGLGSARGSGDRHRFRALRWVVATEVALAVALLGAAGILTKSFRHLAGQPLGFDPGGVLVADLVLPESRYSQYEAQTRAYTDIVDRLRDTPGVTAAAYVITLPLQPRGGVGNKILFDGRPDIDPADPSGARIRPVYGDYFGAMRIPIVRGRGFEPSDGAGAPPVAVINETLASRFWGDRDPLGARIALRDWHDFTEGPVWMTVVGVARDVKGTSLDAGDDPAVYMPYLQRQVAWQRFGSLVIRTAGDPDGFRRPLAEAVWAHDPALALGAVGSLAGKHRAASARERFLAVVIGLFAGAALLLVIQGIWGVVATAVAERRREIGVRMALGARRPGVIGLVAAEAFRPMAIGAVAGLGLALAASRLLASALFEISPTDPAVLAGTVVLTAVVVGLASALPAWRAARIDPLEVIRTE